MLAPSGWVTLEREGLSVRYPFRPLLIATYNPEEAELREHLMDRIGVCLSADATELDSEERLEAVQRAIRFGSDPQTFIKEFEESTDTMSNSVRLRPSLALAPPLPPPPPPPPPTPPSAPTLARLSPSRRHPHPRRSSSPVST